MEKGLNIDKYYELEHHLDVVLAEPLVTFDLSICTLLRLEEAGVRTVGELIGHTEEQLLAIRRIGVGAIREIHRMLKNLNLSLKK